MKTSLLTLLSDQVVPSVLFISSLAEIGDDVFVVTTQKMKDNGKINDLGESLGRKWKIREIVVQNEDSISELSSHLDMIRWIEYDAAYIDLTLGTKIMSLAVHSYFSRFGELYGKPTINFYYQPVGKNQLKKIDTNEVINPPLLTLNEYLAAYGITASNQQEKCLVPAQTTNAVLLQYNERWREASRLFRILRNANKPKWHSDRLIPLGSETFPTIIKETGEEWHPSENELQLMHEFCKAAGFDIDGITRKHIEYLSGGWLEEWFYNKVKEIMPELSAEQIALSLKIKTKTGVENELDVALVNTQNAFRYAECKTSLTDERSGHSFIVETLYKQSAIRKNFGLSAAPIIVTVDEMKDSSIKRAKDLDIRIISFDDIHNEDGLKQKLIEYLKK